MRGTYFASSISRARARARARRATRGGAARTRRLARRRSRAMRRRALSALARALRSEPSAPIVRTKIPGPSHATQMAELDALGVDTGSIRFMIDVRASVGCYAFDGDGNALLDMHGHIASLPLGYNHPRVLRAVTAPENAATLAHRPALGVNPPTDWARRVARTLGRTMPRGMSRVTTMACGACANEHAMKAAFIGAANARRGSKGIGAEERESCMAHRAPGTPNFKVLSFDGAFHGRTAACLSLTHTKWIHKLDFPAFDWPKCRFPKLKYPLDAHAEENALEEERCLEEVEEALALDEDVVAVIVEPIQAEGGDNHASANFFRGLRSITRERGVRLIVDEVQTGCGASGTFWAHEAWGLEHPPDLVTFSKKMQIAGFYATADLAPELPYRIFNTWMGDPAKLIQLEAVLDEIEAENLLDVVKSAGGTLLSGLERLQAKYPNVLSNARGVGTLVAIDCDTPERRDALLRDLLQNGVDIGGCGTRTIRARPSLNFTSAHAGTFLEIFERVLEGAK